MAERARTTSRDCQSSPREERTPPRAWAVAASNCTPVRLGHHRGPRPRAHFQSIKPLGLPSFLRILLPPPSSLPVFHSAHIDLPSPISPSLMSQRQRHSCHGHGPWIWVMGRGGLLFPPARDLREGHMRRGTQTSARTFRL